MFNDLSSFATCGQHLLYGYLLIVGVGETGFFGPASCTVWFLHAASRVPLFNMCLSLLFFASLVGAEIRARDM